MGEQGYGVLGLPFFETFILYMPTTNTKEKWLEKKGFIVLDSGKDERGRYFHVGTHDKALAAAIHAEMDKRQVQQKGDAHE